ncbi:MAG TPA: sigma-54 dependent transcriptional regulator, partial [Candidatus Cloacimonadota bacterium]|nr:sigma-54 dependent transcriptional regulator [Candidatus Cloacimonadota bacterium]
KEIIAQLIHNGGQKSALPFISVNCSAISSSLFESELFGYEKGSFTGALQTGSIGKIELAQGGTIFFDEVGDLPFDMQPKLLRVLQEKELFRIGGKSAIKLDVRFIFATNANLEEMAQQGKFRTDLLYRVNTGKIFIPPLRERKTEIAPLALMLLKEITEQRNKSYKELDKEAVLKLESYHWPGNVRELRSAIERAVILSDGHTLQANQILLNSQDMGLLIPATKNFSLNMLESIFPLEDIEYEIAQYVLKRFDGNITQASRYLNISWRRLKRIAKLS